MSVLASEFLQVASGPMSAPMFVVNVDAVVSRDRRFEEVNLMVLPLDSQLAAILDDLIGEFVDDAISAAALSGSYARGDADAYSDIDLRLYTDSPLEGVEADRLLYRDNRLVSVSLHTFRGEARQLTHPPSAVFAVVPIQTLHPLIDRERSLAVLQQMARRFHWDDIATEADAGVARVVYHQAEVVQKVLGSLAASLPLRAVVTTAELVQELTLAMAIARRVLVVSDRSYLEQVYEAVGRETAWVHAHQMAAGVTTPDGGDAYVARGYAGLMLYRETAALTRALMTREQRAVVDEVIAVVDRHQHSSRERAVH